MAGLLELAEVVAGETGCSKSKAYRAVQGIFDMIDIATEDGEHVTIKGFGSFRRVTRAARTYIPPRSEAVITKPNRRVLAFKHSLKQQKAV